MYEPAGQTIAVSVCDVDFAKLIAAWRKSEAIKVRAWNIPGNLAHVAGDDKSDSSETKPEIVDVRPFVEIEMQKTALHYSPRD